MTTEGKGVDPVTQEIIEAGRAGRVKVETERASKDGAATAALAAEVERRASSGTPMLMKDAVALLRAHLSRNAARRFIDAQAGTAWTLQATDSHGSSIVLLPLSPPVSFLQDAAGER